MSDKDKAMIWSWARVAIAAAVTAALTILWTDGVDGFNDPAALKGVATAALVALGVTVRNYLDPKDPRYGRGSVSDVSDVSECTDCECTTEQPSETTPAA